MQLSEVKNFNACGSHAISNAGGYLIELDATGDAARYLLISDRVIVRGRWQNIKFTANGRAYITARGRLSRLYFDQVAKL